MTAAAVVLEALAYVIVGRVLLIALGDVRDWWRR